jgi:hypothetical protein
MKIRTRTYAIALLAAATLGAGFVRAQDPAGSRKDYGRGGDSAIRTQAKPSWSVQHDATLTGDGTSASPLGVTVPMSLGALLQSGEAVIEGTASGFSNSIGVKGTGGTGVLGVAGSDTSTGISGIAFGGAGVRGTSTTGNGVVGTTSSGIAIFGLGGSGLAGRFSGDVVITGSLSKGGGSFKIDHPLDPENKYLYHSFVESPDMKNVYDGVATLDRDGEATVELPEWFESLNRDFRYLLTPIGAPAPDLYIAEKVSKNRFRIAGGQPGLEVSWQVTGIRQDPWANKNRIPIEEDKPAIERGYYLYPELYDQPGFMSIEYARNPELMRSIKQQNHEPRQR